MIFVKLFVNQIEILIYFLLYSKYLSILLILEQVMKLLEYHQFTILLKQVGRNEETIPF